MEKYNIPSVFLTKYPKILHAEIGSYYAKEKYQIDDEMMNAIRYHTIGHEEMTEFEKIIYLADKIGRKDLSETLKQEKELAYQDLDQALLLDLRRSKEKLEKLNKPVHPETMKLMEKLKKKKTCP